MSAALSAWLRGIEPAGAPELEAALAETLGDDASLAFEAGETLWRARVHRLRFGRRGAAAVPARTLVVKRLSLDRSQRELRAVRRWLPAVGLDAHGPPLLAAAATRDASAVWHLYADLGDGTLARFAAEPGPAREEKIRAALLLAAEVHVRFAAHPLLGEARLHGIELGSRYFANAVGDAARAIAALRRRAEVPGEQQPLLGRLATRLAALARSGEARAGDFAALGWPETLQHGDLWLTNFMWGREAGAPARLIDWDHAGLGPALYDLSTFLRQLPEAERPALLDGYRERVARVGWPWPEPALLERVAETCELARFASCLLWRVLWALEQPRGAALPGWLFEELAEMERWFYERSALLPRRSQASAA